MPPEKGKPSAGKPPVGKRSSAAPGQRQVAEPMPVTAPAPAPAAVPPGCVLTYKRKKVDSNALQSKQEVKKFKTELRETIMDDGYLERQRVHNHLHAVVRSIIKPKYVDGTCQDHFWLSFMNCSDDPYQLSPPVRDGLLGSKEVEEGFHSKMTSTGAANKLKEIMSGKTTASRSDEYKIPSDTVIGKLEGVLYGVLTSGNFGLLCDLICESFQTTNNDQPVKMDFVVGFSSILSKVRNGSYDQSPQLFEQDIQAILKKFMRIGREMSSLANGLAALTKYHCEKLKTDLGGESTVKCNVSGRILENTSRTSQMNDGQTDYSDGTSASEKCDMSEIISEKTLAIMQTACSDGTSAPQKGDMSERSAERTTTGSVGAAAADKCDTWKGIPESAMSSSQVNNQQIGGLGCGLAAGKYDLGGNNFDLEFTNSPFRFLTSQVQPQAGNLGCSSSAEICNVNEKIVESASSLKSANQTERLVCDSAAERSNGHEMSDKMMGSFDKKNQKGTNECAAKMIDMNSCAAAMTNSCAVNDGKSYESVPRSEQTILSWRYKWGTCKRCGTEADGNKSLICDKCDGMYHIACTKPIIQESPVRSWYCAQCSDKNESEEVDVSNDQHDCLHEGCVVCEKLKVSECLEDGHRNTENLANVDIDGKREHSSTCEERGNDIDNESPEPSRTAVLRLCKHCGTREEEDKKFLVCSHMTCHFRYYHIRCLSAVQLARKHQPDGLWYCPSCLCRGCHTDKDDHLVCLCDRCDEAYHTYCMDPPRKAVPMGIWCCTSCNKERIKEGMRKFEENVLSMQLVKNELTTQSKRRSNKKVLKSEHEVYFERTEADCRGSRTVNAPRIVKEIDTEQVKKQLRQASPSSQHKTVQQRQLKQNGVKQGPEKNGFTEQSINGTKPGKRKRSPINSGRKPKINGEIHHQPENNGVTEQPINGTKLLKRKQSPTNSGRNKVRKRQRSHLNGRIDIEGQQANRDTGVQPVEKQASQLPHRRRLNFPGQSPTSMTKQQMNGDFDGESESGVRVRHENGNKEELTDKTNVEDPMGSFGVLLDAVDVSEKMDKEAHKNAANGRAIIS